MSPESNFPGIPDEVYVPEVPTEQIATEDLDDPQVQAKAEIIAFVKGEASDEKVRDNLAQIDKNERLTWIVASLPHVEGIDISGDEGMNARHVSLFKMVGDITKSER